MNVGLVIYGCLATRTGGYRYDREMAAALERRGHRVTVIRLPAVAYPRRLTLNWQPPRAAAETGGRLDLLIQDELCHPSLIRTNRRRWTEGPPVVTVVHQVLCDEPRAAWRNRLLGLVEKRYLDGVDGFVFNSRATRDTVWRLTTADRPHIVATPGGDPQGDLPASDFIATRALRPGPLRLLFVGNLIPRKGLLPLLAALTGLPPGTWELRVAGRLDMDRAHVRQVRQTLQAQGLAGRVRLLGWKEGPALVEELTQAQVLCMPFAYEGFGMASLEAQAYGLPVIGCREGATGELVTEGVNGCLVGRDDPNAVCKALGGLNADRERLREMSLAARQRFGRHPTWAESMTRLAVFLEGLAASMPARGAA